MSYAASVVLDAAAVLMNDQAKAVYTNAVVLPYLKIALKDLQMEYEINNIPVTNETDDEVVVEIGINVVNEFGGDPPNYPEDLVEIQQIWERLDGSEDPYIPLDKFEFLPHNLEGVALPSLSYWSWQDEKIKFNPLGATSDRQLKIDYIKSLFAGVTTADSAISVINSENFLSYRTAALCASFIGENPTRSQELNAEARISLDQALGISNKGRQAITTRRRPFMSSYRSRRVW